eukprot:Gb_22355 [translate_table: standard]
MIKEVKRALKDGEGCRVFGVLDVQRVAGNFHISVHGLNIVVAQQCFVSVTEEAYFTNNVQNRAIKHPIGESLVASRRPIWMGCAFPKTDDVQNLRCSESVKINLGPHIHVFSPDSERIRVIYTGNPPDIRNTC